MARSLPVQNRQMGSSQLQSTTTSYGQWHLRQLIHWLAVNPHPYRAAPPERHLQMQLCDTNQECCKGIRSRDLWNTIGHRIDHADTRNIFGITWCFLRVFSIFYELSSSIKVYLILCDLSATIFPPLVTSSWAIVLFELNWRYLSQLIYIDAEFWYLHTTICWQWCNKLKHACYFSACRRHN